MSVRRPRRGSNLVEFALLIPFLAAALAGTVDLAHYLLLADGVVVAVGEGARSGAQAGNDQSPKEIAALVAEACWSNAGLPGELSLEIAVEGAAPDQLITVTGSAPYEAWFGFIGLPEVVEYSAIVRVVSEGLDAEDTPVAAK